MNYEVQVEFRPIGFQVYKLESLDVNLVKEDIYNGLQTRPYHTLFEMGFLDIPSTSESLSFLWKIAHRFILSLTNDPDLQISKTPKEFNKEIFDELMLLMPYIIGLDNLTYDWFKMLWAELIKVFNEEFSHTTLTVSEFLLQKKDTLGVVGRVYFHLGEKIVNEEHLFVFKATYASGSKKKVEHLLLDKALEEYKGNPPKLLELLSTIVKVSESSELIKDLLETGDLYLPVYFSNEEALIFLKEIGLYESKGIVCRFPNWWKRKSNSKVKVKVTNDINTTLGLNSLLNFSLGADLNGVEVDEEELKKLLKLEEGLVHFKGQWVEINHQKLQMLLDNMKKLRGNLTLSDLIKMQIGMSDNLDPELVEISNSAWLSSWQQEIGSKLSIAPSENFKGQLRHYQQRGCDWLATMHSIGLGALLADDMGLGKTIQILAFLDYLNAQKPHKALLVVPASLLFNWQKEAQKFTPNLKTLIIHSKNRDFVLADHDLFITTYALVDKEKIFKETKWDLLILDEAQAIRNAGTKQARAIKLINADYRIGLTGTPIENRLSDLWSIFDFLNKGMLGSLSEFSDFTKGLKNDIGNYARLKSIVSPLILRRVKTDKSIIKDLPEKIENKVYVGLSKKQIALYEDLIKGLEVALQESEGIQRKGMVLSLILKCKQICNHPDQYSGGTSYLPELSGKFEALKDICQVIKEKRERVLIFTQFKEIIPHLEVFLNDLFQTKGLVLHGDTPIKQRGELVAKFNGEQYVPFMILSLKAGGVGLNLTSANHVVHFDRWWNPASENQATDRAFRIGQNKNVFVHKFIVKGTIEEKIDAIISEKQSLSNDIIAQNNENWITNMSNNDIMNLFKLEY